MIRAAERREKALRMKAGGASMREIARALGFRSVASVHETIETALAEGVERIKHETDRLRAKQLSELETAVEALMAGVQAGDPKAIGAMVRCHERQAHLVGLDLRPDVEDGPTMILIDPRLADGSLPPGADVVDGEIVEEQPALLERGDEADR